jgi:RNA polymerase sigma-70 factor (ECF subfamily)
LNQYQNDSDQQILDAIRQGDEKAFSELFSRYWDTAHRIAYSKVRSLETTQEIVQELFITLWDKRETLVIQNIPAFITTCIKNKAIKIIESQIVKRKYWEYYKTYIPQNESVTESEVDFNELKEAIEAGMERLPAKSKKVFQLNRFHGRSIPEIADMLNLSEKAIEYHLTRSLKHLRLHLRDFLMLIVLILPLLPAQNHHKFLYSRGGEPSMI